MLDPSTDVHRILQRFDPQLPTRVAELIYGRHEVTFLARAVSGTFDVDRCDYLLRDAHATGVSYGRFDLDWLIRSLCFGKASEPDKAPPLAIDGSKGIPAIESFLLARLFMFQQVYFHKTERASEWMLSRVFERVSLLLAEGKRLPGTPPAIVSLSREGDAPLDQYLSLDDGALWVAIASWRDSEDPVLSTSRSASSRESCSRRSSSFRTSPGRASASISSNARATLPARRGSIPKSTWASTPRPPRSSTTRTIR